MKKKYIIKTFFKRIINKVPRQPGLLVKPVRLNTARSQAPLLGQSGGREPDATGTVGIGGEGVGPGPGDTDSWGRRRGSGQGQGTLTAGGGVGAAPGDTDGWGRESGQGQGTQTAGGGGGGWGRARGQGWLRGYCWASREADLGPHGWRVAEDKRQVKGETTICARSLGGVN